MAMKIEDSPPTLPDLLQDGLDVVFVGINPSVYSATQGHYFARRTNRFWPCFSRSRLSLAARTALCVEILEPGHDRALLDHGFGFTDVAKRPSARAAQLSAAELDEGVTHLKEKLERFRPRVACFHGLMGYRPFHRKLFGAETDPKLGLQASRIGPTHLFAVPNPSPAFTPADQTRWYDELAACLAGLGG